MLIFVAYSVLGNLKSYGATRKSSNPPNMLILAAFSVLWSVSDCGVIMTAESSPRDADTDSLRNLPTREDFGADSSTILKPADRDIISLQRFDWNRFTEKPFDWNKFTVKPFDWNRFTVKPFDWNRFTLNPDNWDKFKPHDYHYKRGNNGMGMKVAIFLPIVILIILIFICKYAVCNDRSSTDASSPTLHPPPRRIIPAPPNGIEQPPQNITAPNVIYGATTDKPPDYSEVVWSDFRVGQNQYPGVKPTIPESPPPKYDPGRVMRY